MNLYSKRDLDLLARETLFLRDNLEKVVRLVDILDFVNSDEFLSAKLALKGGTAINLLAFDMPRLSVDIDLDFTDNCGRDEMLETRRRINERVVSFMSTNGYALSPDSKTPHSLDSWAFGYVNAGGSRDIIKIEINYSMRAHVLPLELYEVSVPFLKRLSVRSLSVTEMFASKIKALVSRVAVRDLYDVNGMINAGLFSDPEERDLLRRIFVFYMSVGSACKAEEVDVQHIDFGRIKQIAFPQVRAQLLPVLRRNDSFDFEKAKLKVISFLEELMVFDEREVRYIDAFRKRVFEPSLLFGEGEIADRVRTHPMGLWKCRSVDEK